MEIQKYEFTNDGMISLSISHRGKNWPVVYLISNTKDLYIGETTSAATRMKQHLDNPDKKKKGFTDIRVIFDDEYNKSVILDYEQRLIRCFKADNQYNVINRNAGQSASHDYFQRDVYGNKFSGLWQNLIDIGIAKHPLDVIENDEIFKYSPYNSLTEEQNEICVNILNDICDKLENSDSHGQGISIVNGCAGTGKTVLAISMINSLVNAINLEESDLTDEELSTDNVKVLLRLKKYLLSSSGPKSHTLKIGFVFPMSGIRKTIVDVFAKCGNGLNKNMVLSPYELKKQKYDILFVDESHRLFRRKNLASAFKMFDDTCAALGFPNTSTQLDWVIKQGAYNVLFYDRNQSIKGSDISYSEYQNTINTSGKSVITYDLQTQMRCAGGNAYIDYLRSIIECKASKFEDITNYDFQIFDNVDDMINRIKDLDEKFGLCRNVAGFSWKWITKPSKSHLKTYNDIVNHGLYDIDIDGYHYVWNLSTENWMDREDSRDTIGCIHTTQGFDLNYVGVIFGREIDYDQKTNSVVIDLQKFYDLNVKINSPVDVVKEYIINTYTTIMARGIKGCYVYACNPNMQNYLKQFIRTYSKDE